MTEVPLRCRWPPPADHGLRIHRLSLGSVREAPLSVSTRRASRSCAGVETTRGGRRTTAPSAAPTPTGSVGGACQTRRRSHPDRTGDGDNSAVEVADPGRTAPQASPATALRASTARRRRSAVGPGVTANHVRRTTAVPAHRRGVPHLPRPTDSKAILVMTFAEDSGPRQVHPSTPLSRRTRPLPR